MKMKHDCWVVVMDGEKALFLRNEGDEVHCNLRVFREIEQSNPPSRDQGSAPPGRQTDGVSDHRSAMEETDWHRLAKDRFAAEIADRLLVHARNGQLGDVVLAAPPHVLGAVRKAIDKSVRNKIVSELPKDLTSHPVSEIEAIMLKS